jgi:hypothetical protein
MNRRQSPGRSFFPWLHGWLAPLLVLSLGAAITAVGITAVMLLRGQAGRAVGAMAAAVLLILLAWAIDLGYYFDHEERYQSKPRRHAANHVAGPDKRLSVGCGKWLVAARTAAPGLAAIAAPQLKYSRLPAIPRCLGCVARAQAPPTLHALRQHEEGLPRRAL